MTVCGEAERREGRDSENEGLVEIPAPLGTGGCHGDLRLCGLLSEQTKGPGSSATASQW